jgi:hypothetical protein
MRKAVLPISVSQYKDKNEYQRQWRKLKPGYDKKMRNPEKVREAAWFRRYGITREAYDQMLEDQKGCCAICGTDEIGRGHEYFHVDHDHNTNKIRGLLCDKCNRGLGYFNDNPLTLHKASSYIRQHLYEIATDTKKAPKEGPDKDESSGS